MKNTGCLLPIVVAVGCGSAPSAPTVVSLPQPTSRAPVESARPPLEGKATLFFDDEPRSGNAKIAWSAGDDRVLIEGPRNLFGVYDVPSGKKLFDAIAPGEILDAGFSSDAHRVWIVGVHATAEYQVETGACLGVVEVDSSTRSRAAWSRDGATLAVLTDNGGVSIRDGASLVERWRADASGATEVAITWPADRVLLNGPHLVERDISNGAIIGQVFEPTRPTERVSVSPDGRIAVTLSENKNVLSIVDAISGKSRKAIKLPGTCTHVGNMYAPMTRVSPTDPPAQVAYVAFSPDGRWLAIAHDAPNSVQSITFPRYDLAILDATSGRVKQQIKGATSVSPWFLGDKVVGSTYGSGFSAWSLETGRLVNLPFQLQDPWTPGSAGKYAALIAYPKEPSADGMAASIVDVESGSVLLTSVAAGRKADWTSHWPVGSAIDARAAHVGFAGSLGGGFVAVFDMATSTFRKARVDESWRVVERTYDDRVDRQREVEWFGAGLAVNEESENRVNVMHFFDPELQRGELIPLGDSSLPSVTEALDGSRLVVARDEGVHVYDEPQMRDVPLSTALKRAYHPKYSPDGSILAVESEDATHTLDAKTLANLATIKGEGEFRMMPNGILATHGDRAISLFDARTGAPQGSLDLPSEVARVYHCDPWAVDGTLVLLADGDIWDVLAKRARGNVPMPDWVWFSNDGSRMLASKDYTNWTLYSTTDASPVARVVSRPRETFNSMSPDGSIIAWTTPHGMRLVRVANGRTLDIALFADEKTVDAVLALDTGHWSASVRARTHLRLLTDHGVIAGDDPSAGKFERAGLGADL